MLNPKPHKEGGIHWQWVSGRKVPSFVLAKWAGQCYLPKKIGGLWGIPPSLRRVLQRGLQLEYKRAKKFVFGPKYTCFLSKSVMEMGGSPLPPLQENLVDFGGNPPPPPFPEKFRRKVFDQLSKNGWKKCMTSEWHNVLTLIRRWISSVVLVNVSIYSTVGACVLSDMTSPLSCWCIIPPVFCIYLLAGT